ncbi:MAG: hypothetical protein CEN88_338 [Candidatus Berkelbacteria bacterium Licking1014_2]|uniref:VTT domain-containing protein n=1 Tax=Candidatus Berkelbacteria bacterium Licking1014_2 TaxID=2017146 RepID=A0A554LUD0_9BACT|nr:MAG: hypothetical protein CEN88_338 [Candidatus Berkelbacteria bacterium Licking1014_2]
MEHILSFIASLITNAIDAGGYWAVFGLMTIESAGIPAPSEIIMPFAGFLAGAGKMTLFWLTIVGGSANLFGSIIAYFIGFYGGRPLVEKYGKWILLSRHDLDLSDHFFQKYGNPTVFLSRLLPIIRTYISFPAGIAKMRFLPFCFYTLLGSLPWSWLLAFIGFKMGENWENIRGYFHRFDIVIGILIIAGLFWWIKRHFRGKI